VELEAAGVGGRPGQEPPDDLAELLLVLENAERAVGERLQVEGRIARKDWAETCAERMFSTT
jgi:hypothetical protein